MKRLLLVLLAIAAAGCSGPDGDVVHIQFAEASGVTRDTPVRTRGVLIGRVADVALNERKGTADVELTLFSKYKNYRDKVCRIGTNSLVTGDAVLDFIRATEDVLIARGYDRNKDQTIDEAERKVAHQKLGNGDYMKDGIVQGGSQLTVAKLAEQVAELRADVAELKGRMKRLVDAPDGDGHGGRPDF
jgi:hypothetical protein